MAYFASDTKRALAQPDGAMFVFLSVNRRAAYIVVFDAAGTLLECIEVHSECEEDELGLVAAEKVAKELNNLVKELMEEENMRPQTARELIILQPGAAKASDASTALVMAGYIIARVRHLSTCAFSKVRSRGELPDDVFRRRVFETLSADDLEAMDLTDASKGMIETIGLGLDHFQRLKAHAASIGLA